jgi:peptidoglycan hydrolase-like protein with peptidoglycan-binding domain
MSSQDYKKIHVVEDVMAAHPIIKLGSKGDAVKLAQQRLLERFYLFNKTDVDGAFGFVTLNAVINYQRDRSQGQFFAFSFPLAIDGIVGNSTWFRLDPDTVKKGSKGHGVRLLQEILKSFSTPDYDPGNVDSDFGPITETAVKNFQRDFFDFDGNPLKQDGIVGPKTWAALFS